MAEPRAGCLTAPPNDGIDATDGRPHVFFPTGGEAGLATEILAARLVAAGHPPERICVLWGLGHFRTARLPEGVVELALPSNYLITEALPAEFAKRFRLARWWQAARRAHPALLARPAHWYVCLPIQLPANQAMFAGQSVSLALLPDGQANYAPASAWPEPHHAGIAARLAARARYLARQVVEVLAAASVGLRYRPILRGSKFQHERGLFARTYTFDAEGLVSRSGRVVELCRPRPAAARAPDPRRAIIADQELGEIVDRGGEAALRAGLIAALNARALEVVLYKPHPRGRDRLETYRAGLRHPVRPVSGTGPLEEIAAEEGCGLVISYFSTTLAVLAPVPDVACLAVLPASDMTAPDLRDGDTDPAAYHRRTLAAAGVEIVPVPLPARATSGAGS